MPDRPLPPTSQYQLVEGRVRGGEMRKEGKSRTRSSLAKAHTFNPRTREAKASGSL